jgi:hypothetical protein
MSSRLTKNLHEGSVTAILPTSRESTQQEAEFDAKDWLGKKTKHYFA